MLTFLLILLAWTVLSIPFGMFVGKVLGYCSRDRK